MTELTDQLKDRNLKHTVQYGVGFIFEGMDEQDREIVENLYKEGLILVLICTYNLCWDVNSSSHCVIILET